MNRSTFFLSLLVLASSFAAGWVRAAETNAASRFEYPAFRIIEERNIFNPNRSAGASRSSYTSRRERQSSRADTFVLRGTMSYEKGRFAFFEGSKSDYRKALEVEGQIAGYKVAEIGSDYVKLESNGKELSLRVGMQMKKQDQGEWALADASEPIESSSASEPSVKEEGTETAEKPDAAVSAGGNDVLRRLLQKRAQELNNEGGKEKNQPESTPNEKP